MAVAIIAEYNPFHNGHIHQLKKAKELFPGEEIIIVLSQKYVQRGEIAIASFEERKKYALQNGADKVIPLPFECSTQAAHIFAQGAVKIAYENGATKLFFGSESDDASMLMKIAKTIKDNEQEYFESLRKELKQGIAFPKASANVLSSMIGTNVTLPNDILGLEYCKAIVNNNYPIVPYTLKRTIGFHDVENVDGEFASATKIRQMVFNGEDVSKFTPMTFKLPIERIEDHYKEFQEIVRNSTLDELRENPLISEGMENLFKKHIELPTYEEFVSATNSKRYTSSRIKRVMLYTLLKIKR